MTKRNLRNIRLRNFVKRKRRFDKVRIDDDKELKALEELERKEGKAHISDD